MPKLKLLTANPQSPAPGRKSSRHRRRQGPPVASGRRFIRCFGLWPFRLLCRLANLRTTTSVAPEHLETVYQLRYRIYLGEGFIEARPEARFQDAFDHWSEQILISRGGRPVATCRLILGAHPAFEGFWTDSLFALKDLPPAVETAEVSRLGVDRDDRGQGNLVFLALLLAIHDASHRHGFRYLMVNMPPSLARLVQGHGIIPRPLEQSTPEAHHLENRKLISGYFARKQLQPYLFDLKDIYQSFRLRIRDD